MMILLSEDAEDGARMSASRQLPDWKPSKTKLRSKKTWLPWRQLLSEEKKALEALTDM